MTYTPQPGTLQHRVITWLKLQPIGAEFPSAVIAEELGVEPGTIPSSMTYPVEHGLLNRRKEGGLVMWSLGNGIAQPKPADYEPDVPLNQLPPIKVRPSRMPKPKTDKPVQVPVFLKGQEAETASARQSSGINVEVIERLRSAALSHGEVADLLQVLSNCFPTFQDNYDFRGDLEEAKYLETVLMAAQFAAYDRGEVAKDGV